MQHQQHTQCGVTQLDRLPFSISLGFPTVPHEVTVSEATVQQYILYLNYPRLVTFYANVHTKNW